MALLTVARELRGTVIRRGGGVVVGEMALRAVGVCERVIPVDMARLAGLGAVRSGQRELCCRMVERGWFPCAHTMAFGAVVIEARGGVIGRACCREVALVTLETIGVGEGVIAVDVA